MINEDMIKYTKQDVNITYAVALEKLIDRCIAEGVEIDKVYFYMGGFMVTFKGLAGDAICHEGSYGRISGDWETMNMPWDYDDVSVHSAEALAKMLSAWKDGRDWEVYDK